MIIDLFLKVTGSFIDFFFWDDYKKKDLIYEIWCKCFSCLCMTLTLFSWSNCHLNKDNFLAITQGLKN